MMNLEIYEKRPAPTRCSTRASPKSPAGIDAELDTLRYELTNFVCDGQYAEGLSRILSTYLATWIRASSRACGSAASSAPASRTSSKCSSTSGPTSSSRTAPGQGTGQAADRR